MIAMVTGASSGFGEAISRQLVQAGYRVIGTGRRAERLAVVTQLGDLPGLGLHGGHRLVFAGQATAEAPAR